MGPVSHDVKKFMKQHEGGIIPPCFVQQMRVQIHHLNGQLTVSIRLPSRHRVVAWNSNAKRRAGRPAEGSLFGIEQTDVLHDGHDFVAQGDEHVQLVGWRAMGMPQDQRW